MRKPKTPTGWRLTRLTALLLAGTCLGAIEAKAVDSVWGGTVDTEWTNPANWSGALVPDGRATFDVTAASMAVDINGLTIVGQIQYSNPAPAFTITANDFVIINGLGVFNESASNQTITNNAGIVFQGNSSASGGLGAGAVIYGNNSSLIFQDTSTAGAATINNSSVLQFFNSSNAGTATIVNGVELDFFDTSSASAAQITNNVMGTITFNNSATAANATIGNSGSIAFSGTSTAGGAIITNSLGGFVSFGDSATAGNAGIGNSGTLTFNDAASAGAATIANSGTGFTIFNNSSTGGTATIDNTGTVTFNDTSSAALATLTNVVSGASIVFNNVSTAGGAIIANNGGSLAFNDASSAGTSQIANSGNVDFFASSSAAGSAITNDGSVTFHDASTAANATITNNALLSFLDTSTGGSARLINDAAATIDISGLSSAGTAIGSIEGAGFVNLGAKNLAVGGNNLSASFAGVISGVGGSLTKTGTGGWTLSGIGAYTGATSIDAGTLIVTGDITSSSGVLVNSGGTLAGTGIVGSTVIAGGGSLAPGANPGIGTLSVNGNLTLQPGATYVAYITASGANGKTVATGTAGIDGNLVVSALPGSYAKGQIYTLINSTGLLTGSFASVNSLGLFGLAPVISYDDHNVFLTLQQLQLAGLLPSGAPTNAVNVASVLDRFIASGGTLPGSFQTLFGLSPSALSQALNQAAGQTGLAADQGIYTALNSFVGAIFDFNGPGRMTGGAASSFAAVPPLSAQAALAYAAVTPKDRMVTKAVLSERYDPRWSVWAAGFGGTSQLPGSPVTGSQDVTSRVFGGAAGADYWVSRDTTLGLAMSGGETSYSLSNGFGSGHSDYVQGALYGKHRFGDGYLAAALAGGSHRITTDRTVAFAADHLTASYTATTIAGRIEGGYRFGSWSYGITPYGAVQAQSVFTPAYTETARAGSGASALSYDARDVTATRTELGGWGDHRILTGNGEILLRARAAWVHDFNRDASVIAGFPALPGANFLVNGARHPSDSALLTAVAEVPVARNMTLSVKFDGEFASGATTWAGTGAFRYIW